MRRSGPQRPPRDASRLRRAFDEARFGRERILDLHEDLPTAPAAADRAERWLRARQARGVDDVLVITGRGAHSGGVSAVRTTVLRRLQALRRAGVVAAIVEHGAGSFVVTPAPMRSLIDAPRRRRKGPAPAPPAEPPALAALEPETRSALRELASIALDSVGVRDPSPRFIEDEMGRQFSRLASSVSPGDEVALRRVIARALDEYGAP